VSEVGEPGTQQYSRCGGRVERTVPWAAPTEDEVYQREGPLPTLRSSLVWWRSCGACGEAGMALSAVAWRHDRPSRLRGARWRYFLRRTPLNVEVHVETRSHAMRNFPSTMSSAEDRVAPICGGSTA
jgi:hypothetical protein